jgi:hypothetical protein
LLCAAATVAGCSPTARDADEAAGMPVEAAWSEQVAAVRAGESREIVVQTRPVSTTELLDMAKGCERLQVLEIDECDADEHCYAAIGDLARLRTLKLGAPVDDEALAQIVRAEQLTTLNLPQARFTDAGLEAVASLPNLQLLRFHSPLVTDAGLQPVSGMKSLRFLHLIDVPITDAGLKHLHAMTWLESFYLDGGNCTDESLYALLDALPELHFHKDQLHLPEDPHGHPHQ